jgi:hypothetical protein
MNWCAGNWCAGGCSVPLCFTVAVTIRNHLLGLTVATTSPICVQFPEA